LKATEVTRAKKAPDIISARQSDARKQAIAVLPELDRTPTSEKRKEATPKLCRLRRTGMEVADRNGRVRPEKTILDQTAARSVPKHIARHRVTSLSIHGLNTNGATEATVRARFNSSMHRSRAAAREASEESVDFPKRETKAPKPRKATPASRNIDKTSFASVTGLLPFG
jgi:hypothetical protein